MRLQFHRCVVVVLIILAGLVSQDTFAQNASLQCATYVVGQLEINGVPQDGSLYRLVLCPNKSYMVGCKTERFYDYRCGQIFEEGSFTYIAKDDFFVFNGKKLSKWGKGQRDPNNK